jgi:hypothetical protein
VLGCGCVSAVACSELINCSLDNDMLTCYVKFSSMTDDLVSWDMTPCQLHDVKSSTTYASDVGRNDFAFRT